MNTSKLINKIGISGLLKISLVAAIYVVLTVSLGELSYGPIQARVSELLNFLAFIDPLYIPALVLGCAISNFYSFGLIDVIVGSFSTFVATYLMYKSKNMLIASIWPTLCSLFIAAEFYFYLNLPFWASFATAALGEFFISTIIGYPIFKVLFKNKHFVNAILISKNKTKALSKLKVNI